MTQQQKPGSEPFLPGRVSSTSHTLQIKCPNFVAHGTAQIRCRGITEDTRVALRFMDKKALKLHEKLFCRQRYWCCEICRMLDMIDQEDE